MTIRENAFQLYKLHDGFLSKTLSFTALNFTFFSHGHNFSCTNFPQLFFSAQFYMVVAQRIAHSPRSLDGPGSIPAGDKNFLCSVDICTHIR